MQLIPHQSQAKTKLLPNKVAALFMKPGLGKTRVAIELVNAVPNIDLVIWIAPLQTIAPKDPTLPPIEKEIAKWGGFNATETVYMGIETIQASDSKYLHLYRKIATAFRCFLIVDESITIKNSDAKRTRRMMELANMVEYKCILNGEPITKDLLDIYSQINFLSPKILNMSLAEFKNTYCQYTTITKSSANWGKTYTKQFITGYENVDHLYSLIGEYVFECDVDLGLERVFTEEYYSLDDEHMERYNLLKQKYLDDEMLQMKNNNIFLEITMKMQHEYCCTPAKFELVDEWFKNYPQEETIIFCKYIASAEACRKAFPKATVLNYQSGSYSYNLQHLRYMIQFDKTFDWGRVTQGLARNFRLGSQGVYRVLTLTGNVGLESLMKANNDKKQNLSQYLKTISREQLKAVL